MQVDSIKPRVESTYGFSALKLKPDKLLSKLVLKFNLRRHTVAATAQTAATADRLPGRGLRSSTSLLNLSRFLSLKPAKHPTTWDRKCSR